jgi:hypothetical protein
MKGGSGFCTTEIHIDGYAGHSWRLSVNLRIGDMLYYKPHKAVGVLVHYDSDRGEWKYILRSALCSDKSGPCTTNPFTTAAIKIVKAIAAGTLKHYPAPIGEEK